MLPSSQQEELRTELTTLKSILDTTDELDGATSDSIRSVVHDIERLLQEPKAEEWPRVKQSWSDALLDFESHHPALTKAVSTITGVLANAGI